jgi:phage tail sheath protein FI
MPSALTYPGVYVEEIPSGVRTITGVSTANTAFVDFFPRGPMNRAVRLSSLADFERTFGGLDARSEASYGVRQYYTNGGSVAWVIRVAAGTPVKASISLDGGSQPQPVLTVRANSEGEWANEGVQVAVVNADNGRFNLFVRRVAVDETGAVQAGVDRNPIVLEREDFRNPSMDPASPDYVVEALRASAFIEAVDEAPEGEIGELPTGSDGGDSGSPQGEAAWQDPTGGPLRGGDDGDAPTSTELLGSEADRTGLRALDAIAPEVFNLLCLPGAANLADGPRKAVYAEALAYCIAKRAFLLVDIPPAVRTPDNVVAELGNVTTHNHAALYYPRLLVSDPLNAGRPRDVAASGTMAGVYARTDVARGVWKAPAGTEAVLFGADLARVLTDGDNGRLNPMGINAIRNFPIFGNVAWGARTLDGADQKASEWKYIPVRRTALFIEESLFQALKWVVFEPNDEPLWAQIRLNVGAFLNDLFRQGAFQGRTPREAYFVRCDKETTTQNDVNRGVVNIVVGFAPLKPAEFVVIKVQQIAGQVQV